MYTSHYRRMPVILMLLYTFYSEIFSHKSHTKVFFLLHYHTKFPVHTESLRRCLSKPVLRTSPSSRLGMCSSVQIPCSNLPSLIVTLRLLTHIVFYNLSIFISTHSHQMNLYLIVTAYFISLLYNHVP